MRMIKGRTVNREVDGQETIGRASYIGQRELTNRAGLNGRMPIFRREMAKGEATNRIDLSRGSLTRREFIVRPAMSSRRIISRVIINKRPTGIRGMDTLAIIDNRAVIVRLATGDRKTDGRATATSIKGTTGAPTIFLHRYLCCLASRILQCGRYRNSTAVC